MARAITVIKTKRGGKRKGGRALGELHATGLLTREGISKQGPCAGMKMSITRPQVGWSLMLERKKKRPLERRLTLDREERKDSR